jgi:hypothetical protein
LPPLGSVDLILAADCVYFEPAFPLLVQTLSSLCTVASDRCEILFCYKQRRKVWFPGSSPTRLTNQPFTGRQTVFCFAKEAIFLATGKNPWVVCPLFSLFSRWRMIPREKFIPVKEFHCIALYPNKAEYPHNPLNTLSQDQRLTSRVSTL